MFLTLSAALALGAVPAGTASPKPAILVFGTGWGADGTQASIEANVIALSEVLTLDRALVGGGPSVRSVQVSGAIDETSELLGMVLDRSDGLHVEYRRPLDPKVGPASKAEVLMRLGELIRSGRPVVVFGAGHGKGDDDDGPAALELWGPDDRLTLSTLQSTIDDAHPKAAVALVLGQCHSGAFTALAFEGKEPTEPPRCVFSAVPGDRASAGCTADLSDPDARAYLDTIASAFRGKAGDRDGDGLVSLAEAHAFAILHDTTIDVPMKSSDDWLEARVKKIVVTQATLLEATPLEKTVLSEVLPSHWTTKGPRAIEAELSRLEAEESALEDRAEAEAKEATFVRVRVADRLLARFPELTNPYHPKARALLAGAAAEVRSALEADPELAVLREKLAQATHAEAQSLDVARARAKFERWSRSARHVARRAKLKASDRRSLEKLYGCESIAP